MIFYEAAFCKQSLYIHEIMKNAHKKSKLYFFSTSTIVPEILHQGDACFDNCQFEGKCSYCGNDGLCCRKGDQFKFNGCDGISGGKDRHKCVPASKNINLKIIDMKVGLQWYSLPLLESQRCQVSSAFAIIGF